MNSRCLTGPLLAILLAFRLTGSGAALPQVPNIEGHLTDSSKKLAKAERESIDTLLGSIQEELKVDMAVLILAAPVESLREMGQSCFQTWSIGKSWEGGGVLMVISHDLKDVVLITSASDHPLPKNAVPRLEGRIRDALRVHRLAEVVRSAIEQNRRTLTLQRPRATVPPPLTPNREAGRRYALGVGVVVAAALGGLLYRRTRPSKPEL